MRAVPVAGKPVVEDAAGAPATTTRKSIPNSGQ